MSRIVAAASTALLVLSVAAGAQEPSRDVEFEGAVPASPAFLFLDATPEKISRPSTARDLGLSLLNGVDENGELAQGFALEASPWIYFGGLSVTPEDYRSNWRKRAFANLQISLGTRRRAGDGAGTDLAFGLRIPLYDAGDPMADAALVRQLGQALQDCLPDDNQPDIPVSVVQVCTDRAVSELFRDYTAEHWNSARLSFAVASGVRIDRGEPGAAPVPDLTDYLGLQAWLSGSLPVLGSGGVLLGQAAFLDRPEFASDSEQRSLTIGGRLALGSAGTNFFIEALGEITWPDGGERDSSGSWSTGFELRLTEDLWVSTGLGRTFDSLTEPDRTVVLANIRWAVTSAARMGQLIQGARAAVP